MIKVKNLAKNYGKHWAVKDITFQVEKGEIFGFLGPNGAGKTTTIKMLTCQLHPSKGSASIANYDLLKEKQKIKSLIGVVFEEQNLYERLSVNENLALFTALYNISQERITEILARIELLPQRNVTVKKLSRGLKQRLLIARALLHKPRVLFLDEPTSGLDPHSAREIRQLIKELSHQEVTILIATHCMEEAEQLCHRIAIIDEGQIVIQDTPSNLKKRFSPPVIQLHLKENGRELYKQLTLSAKDLRYLSSVIKEKEIISIKSIEASLEEVFINLTGKKLI